MPLICCAETLRGCGDGGDGFVDDHNLPDVRKPCTMMVLVMMMVNTVICCAEAPYNGDGGDDSDDDIYVVGKP